MRRILLHALSAILLAWTTVSAQDKIRIGYIGLSLSSMPLLAARDLGMFAKNGVQAEVLLLTS